MLVPGSGVWAPMPRRLRRMLLGALGLLGLGLMLVAGIRSHILDATATRRVTVETAPHRPVALVLGAKVWGDRPSDILEDRLRAALELYESGRCDKLLLSGAHDRDDYDEVGAMRRWLQERGVPPDDLYLDHAGLRTFDSMARARTIFGVEELLVVSQEFHIPRAVYIGEQLGLDVVGVAAPAGYDYPAWLHRHNDVREHLAQTRAWLDLHVLPTEPKFGGEPIDLAASGRVTH